MLKEQAQLLRDLAEAPDQHPEVRERMRKLAQDCQELAEASGLGKTLGRAASGTSRHPSP